ncbi:telomere-protecting terminal protein Tpg [Streptomyces sp. 8N706]|uniref:telomere-protecting terminal protein Tpg n=1 Tax=Streptomyces sp. 8N706 TaxID=3457416 RepID=UPI003FD4A248
MTDIHDALHRADQEVFTREPPKGLQARINFLIKQLKTTRAIAQELGVTQRSVERYRTGERKKPPKAIADRIEAAVRARWHRRSASAAGSRLPPAPASPWRPGPASATPPPSAPPTTAASGRLTVHLPPAYAARLFDAREQGATDQQMRTIVAEGLQEIYFKDGGRRATDLEVEFTDIDYVDLSF